MTQRKLVRITDVITTPQGLQATYYYDGDRMAQAMWQGTDADPVPAPGDVIEMDLTMPGRGARLIGRPHDDGFAGGDAMRWRQPLPCGLSRMDILRRRHAIRRAVRDYLDGAGFIEIEAPLLVHGTTPDIAVESFSVQDRYLVTSTEYQMKRLAIGGFEKIYSLTKNFRPGDESAMRNPEFTMLEWGRVGDRMTSIEQDAQGFVTAAMAAIGLTDTLVYQGRSIDMRTPWERRSVVDVVRHITGVDLTSFDAPSCYRAAQAAGIEVKEAWADDRDFLFSLLMDHIQPRLGLDRPLILCDWPMFQTTSADLGQDGTTVNRSEIFIAGVELSDGFAGLADPDIQSYLFRDALEKRAALGMDSVALDERYLTAMRAGAPYGAGMAMGFDRLVMLLCDQPTIRSVLALAWDEV